MCELLLYIYTLCISLSYIPYSEQASNYTVVPVSVCAIAPPSLRANSPRDSEKKKPTRRRIESMLWHPRRTIRTWDETQVTCPAWLLP